jgi:hypothetical protein
MHNSEVESKVRESSSPSSSAPKFHCARMERRVSCICFPTLTRRQDLAYGADDWKSVERILGYIHTVCVHFQMQGQVRVTSARR